MTPTRSRRRPPAGLLAVLGALSGAAGAGTGAAVIERIGAVTIVSPAPDQRPVLGAERLQHDLEEFAGTACDPEAIAESLAAPYRFLGYVPAIEARCGNGTLAVTIRESSHVIAVIGFEAADLAPLGLSAAPDPDERVRLYPVPRGPMRPLLRGLLQTRQGDLYNFERYRSDRDALARLGYTIAFVPGPPPPGGGYPEGAYLIQALQPEAAAPRQAAEPNYIGATATYGPQQGSAVGGVYQRRGLVSRFDRISLAADYSTGINTVLDYAAPVLADRAEPRRLYDVEMRLFSRFRNDRQLPAGEADERRTGAALGLGIRPLGLRAPHALRVSLGLRHEEVRLEDDPTGTDPPDLTVVALGVEHEWRHAYARPSLWTRFSPVLDVALEAAGGEARFTRPGIDLILHARTRPGIEYDLHLSGGTVAGDAPLTELPGIGGASTVRGFREDAFLGRRAGALQLEAWFPFVRPAAADPPAPGAAPAVARFEPRVARHLKWALFADTGIVAGAPQGDGVTITGAGVGLRFVVPRQPLVIRIDYGRGLGSEGGEWFPYVSLAYRF